MVVARSSPRPFFASPEFGMSVANRCRNLRSDAILLTAPGGARTHNLQLRRLSLYPIELRVRGPQGSLFWAPESRSELDFGEFRGWSVAVKKFLLVLALFSGAAYAQDEVALSSAFGAGEGVDGEVLAVAIQPDGKIVIGGRFGAVNGIARSNIARLDADGTLDRTFADQLGQGVNGQVNVMAVQPDGGIVVGGTFTQAGQVEAANLARYRADGKIDESFGGADASEPGTNGTVYALAVQPDGKIVVGGDFNAVFGQQRRSIARLNADGTPDVPVNADNAVSGTVRAIASGSDGSFVAGGRFALSRQNVSNLLKVPGR
jgi:uncharacterized delta-60 repeat protein